MKNSENKRESERGSAGAKFILTLSFLVLLAHAGYNYVPVAYNAESLKSEMGTAILQGLAMPGKVNAAENVKARIARSIQINDIPADAFVDVKQTGNMITAHVVYNKQVNILPFGIYKYTYRFDHTATPTGFLLK
ncbi:hypothetical protein BH10ACI3_BH10ACI3_17420 [soil metagenome]